MENVDLLISPCPNDTFVFHAMIHSLVDTMGMKFNATFLDIDQLNGVAKSAPEDSKEVIKVSCAVLGQVSGRFGVLPSGGAMGRGNGPLLVSRRRIYPDELSDVKIAIPGVDTTANHLMEILLPDAHNKTTYLFSDIAPAIMDNQVDAGVLIHEGRFTYSKLGLRLIADLGQLWDERFDLPIPLGAIVVGNGFDHQTARNIGRVIRSSVAYAMANPMASMDFVRSHARELEGEVLNKHISYFVNEYTLNMGVAGRHAIHTLLGEESRTQIKFIEQ